MNEETRTAALAIYGMATSDIGGEISVGFGGSDKYSVPYQAMLAERAKEAAHRLEEYRKGRALRVAIDALAPGWFDIDASEYVAGWRMDEFISDDPDEWVAYLIERGVPAEAAHRLVANSRGEG